jgi:hypothetical protein
MDDYACVGRHRRKNQFPRFQVLAPEEIYPPLAFFPLIGDAIGILDSMSTSFAICRANWAT